MSDAQIKYYQLGNDVFWGDAQTKIPPGAVEISKATFDALSAEPVEVLFDRAVTAHVLEVVRANQFESLGNVAASALVVSPFQAKAQALLDFNRDVWVYVVTEQAKVFAGQRPMPAIADFIAELPVFAG